MCILAIRKGHHSQASELLVNTVLTSPNQMVSSSQENTELSSQETSTQEDSLKKKKMKLLSKQISDHAMKTSVKEVKLHFCLRVRAIKVKDKCKHRGHNLESCCRRRRR